MDVSARDDDDRPLPVAGFRGTPDDIERQWYEQVYHGRGDSMAQLTWRAVLVGSCLGSVLSLTNLYIGLKAGWGFGVAITACILSYAIWTILLKIGIARTPMTILENNCMQSTASSAGYSTGGTLVSAFAAYIIVNHQPMSVPLMLAWVFFIAVLGVTMAIPMKRQMINIEQLRFPSGIAAAETLRALHAEGSQGLRAAKALGIAGLIDRFGQIDPTDGGETNRFSLSSRLAHTGDYGVTRVDAYAIRSSLTLFNDFTYFLNDPVNGDQFSQLDRRTSMGFDANHTFKGRLGQFDSETKIGLQSRSDSIDVGLLNTVQQVTLSAVRLDHVSESNVSPYAQNTTRWSDWLRTTVGIRGDLFWGKVASDTAANSGAASAFLASPKFGVVMGPFAKTEFYVNAGYGFHSNDLRGVTITVNPPNAPDAGLPANKVPLLVRSQGAEVGLRTKAIDGLESTLVAFVLDFASELQFEGDSGTTAAGRPSRRTGIEWTNHYQVRSWLAIDADLAISRARFTDFDVVGDYIPGSPMTIASVTATIGEATGWFGSARFRYLGPRPLIEDGSVWSGPMRVVNARVGYRFDNGLRVQLDALNLFNSNDHQIDYYYASRLPGEPAEGVNDIHFHPVEPTSVRLTVAGKF